MSNRPIIAYRKAESSNTLASADELNRLVTETESDWIAFCTGDDPALVESCENRVAQFADSTHSAVLMTAAGAFEGRCDDWQDYPPRLASLIRTPESIAVPIIRLTALSLPKPFHDLNAPLWDWFIRATRNGETIAAVTTEISLNRLDPDDILLDLAPAHPGPTKGWLHNHLQSVEPEELVDSSASTADSIALKAGLLQMHDYLDESHQQSQSIEGKGRHRAGDYWHAIMHRREPDYSNAKYWFRRVGRHPIFAALAEQSTEILDQSNVAEASDWQSRLVTSQGWDPFAFVDICQASAQSPEIDVILAAKRIQACEMRLLLAQTYADASDASGGAEEK